MGRFDIRANEKFLLSRFIEAFDHICLENWEQSLTLPRHENNLVS